MIDAGTSAALARIAARERDVANAYRPGFVPESNDVAHAPRAIATPDPLSVAAPPGAYFLNADQNGKIAFSRDGAFHIVDGELRGPDGRAVLGFAPGNRNALTPLRIDPYDRALGGAHNASIDAGGTLGYVRTSVDPRSGERRVERVTVGKLAVARFPAGTQPVRIDAVHVAPPPGVKAQIGVPADGNFSALVPHARDLGGVDIIAGLEKMKEAYDSFDVLRAAHRARGATEKTALDLVK
jgi:flagellar basal body rod protein FlgG